MFDVQAGRDVAESEAMKGTRCRILRDPAGPLDDALDLTTGQLVKPPGDEVTIWEGGCIGPFETALDSRQQEGGRTAHRRAWRVRIPMLAPLPAENDIFLMLYCERDPTLVGRRFRITDPNQSALGVTRRLGLEDEKGVTVR